MEKMSDIHDYLEARNDRLVVENAELKEAVGTLKAVLGGVAWLHMKNRKGNEFTVPQGKLGDWVADLSQDDNGDVVVKARKL